MAKKLNLFSSGVMAEINKQIDKQNEERQKEGLKERKKFGEFTESTGGGTPIPKGKTIEDMEGKPGFHRVEQPRDEEGKFTYNSANGKGLKYGPSRGTTKPPFLNGVDLTFIEKGTTMKTEDLERIISTIDMSVDQLIENCKHYLESEEGFAGMANAAIKKMGRQSKAEKESTGGITGKMDLSKASENTKQRVNEMQEKYQASEDTKRRAEPGIGSSPSTNYNQAGVTSEGLELREAWREMLKKKMIEKKKQPENKPVDGPKVPATPGSTEGKNKLTKEDFDNIRQELSKFDEFKDFVSDLTDDEIQEAYDEGILNFLK